MLKVQVKWNKEKYDLQVNSDQEVSEFKVLLYSLTNVPVEKQKVIFKGQVFQNEKVLSDYKITENAAISLIGNPESNQTLIQPKQQIVFIEDMTKEQKAQFMKQKAGIVVPAGLKNLGNTCYLNSTIQCMRRINELKKFFNQEKITQDMNPANQLLNEFSKLFKLLETAGDTVAPWNFLSIFMSIFPQFAEQEHGTFKQQDADECMQNILQTLHPVMNTKTLEDEHINLINQLFGIQLEIQFQNTDMPSEICEKKYEFTNKLMCSIDNQQAPVEHMSDGIKLALEESVEKKSEFDGLNHIYNKMSRINKLPSYLIVQMSRFFWKKASEASGTQATKAKILRALSFPKVLDVFPYCSTSLQENLQKGRDYEKKKIAEEKQNEHEKFELYKTEQEKLGNHQDTKELFRKFKDEQADNKIKEHDQQLYCEHGMGLETGNYELVGVITHKGRTADSGHYVAWVHERGDEWLKYDDDVVTVVKIEDILNLKGGGDWHMTYICLYRKLEVQ